MWDKLLTFKTVHYMKKVAEDGDSVEESKMIYLFFGELRERIKDYKVIVMLATQWKTYSDTKQANLAIHFMGEFHASRFITFMDYLSEKFIRGELK